MRPSQARKAEGRAGGMAFQVRRYVSLTHSSASPWLRRMFQAMLCRKVPYLPAVS